MGFQNLYNQIIVKESQISKNRIIPRKVYKILTYEYADGTLKTLSGTKTSIIFAIGITPDKMLHCLKISEVQPNKFFNWLKSSVKNNLDYEQIAEKINQNKLEEITIKDTKFGTKFFQKVKSNLLYKNQPGTYRTYIISNIKSIAEVTFDSEKVLKLLKITKPAKTPQKEN